MGEPQSTERTVLFPRAVLQRFRADQERAVPGTCVESPPWTDAGGNRWQVNLYPFGGNADPAFAGRVGVYLKSSASSRTPDESKRNEIQTTVSIEIHCMQKWKAESKILRTNEGALHTILLKGI